jgi:hypothetical protein
VLRFLVVGRSTDQSPSQRLVTGVVIEISLQWETGLRCEIKRRLGEPQVSDFSDFDEKI